MAHIGSMAIGDGRKSLANIIYRFVNGRIIASKRVTKNNSRPPRQEKQCFAFSLSRSIGKSLHLVINLGFVRNQHGTAISNFMHYNSQFMTYARKSANLSKDLPPISNLCIALNDPEFADKIPASDGSLRLMTLYS